MVGRAMCVCWYVTHFIEQTVLLNALANNRQILK